MSEPWLTIIPMYNLWSLPNELQLPFEFNDRTSLRILPDWLQAESESDTVDLLLPKVRESLPNNVRYCRHRDLSH